MSPQNVLVLGDSYLVPGIIFNMTRWKVSKGSKLNNVYCIGKIFNKIGSELLTHPFARMDFGIQFL